MHDDGDGDEDEDEDDDNDNDAEDGGDGGNEEGVCVLDREHSETNDPMATESAESHVDLTCPGGYVENDDRSFLEVEVTLAFISAEKKRKKRTTKKNFVRRNFNEI